MKDVKETLLERTSVRRYTYDSISDEQLAFIYRAVENTPTSYNGQQFSVIDITDQDLKVRLYEITGQKQIKTCNHFFVFCADYNKISVLARRKDIPMVPVTDTMDGLIIGVVDAALAMMSAIVAAEACGLGSNCIGFLRTADPLETARLLGLPKGVFVVCGLAVGVPNEHPDLKPKQPASLVFHKNRYADDEKRMADELLAYDENVRHYNMTRSGHRTDNDWCGHIIGYYREALSYRILDYLRSQGFNINR